MVSVEIKSHFKNAGHQNLFIEAFYEVKPGYCIRWASVKSDPFVEVTFVETDSVKCTVVHLVTFGHTENKTNLMLK